MLVDEQIYSGSYVSGYHQKEVNDSKANVFVFSRWSYGIVMWEVFTIGKSSYIKLKKQDRTNDDVLYLTQLCRLIRTQRFSYWAIHL